MQGPEPGWLDDPDDPQRVRWWDGQQWTEHRKLRDTLGSAAHAGAPPDPVAGAESPASEATAVTVVGEPEASGPAPTGSTVGDLNTMAATSLVASLVWAGGLGSIAAIILGVIGRRQIEESGGSQRGEGMALAGILIGVLGLVVPLLLFIGLFAGTATDDDFHHDPGMFGNATDADVQEALRALRAAQENHFAEHGRYADEERLRQLEEGHLDVVIMVDLRPDGYCIEAFPAAGGRPQRVTDDDPEPSYSSC